MGFLNGDASLYSKDVSWMIGLLQTTRVHATPGSQTLELVALRPFLPPPFTARLELNMPRALTMMGGSVCLEHQPSCRRPWRSSELRCGPMARAVVLKQTESTNSMAKKEKERKKRKSPQTAVKCHWTQVDAGLWKASYLLYVA